MSSCKLKFMRNSPLRTTLVDDVTGHVKYRIETPIRIARSVTRIRKSKSSTPSPIHFDEDANDEEETIFHEINDEIARIYWKWFSSDKIIFRGRITVRSEFLLKCGKLKGSFAFTGPDGVQYRWAMGPMGMNPSKLVTTDGKKTVIAEFHQAQGFLSKQEAILEVQPAGMDMLDEIVLTFVLVEQTRRERLELAAKYL